MLKKIFFLPVLILFIFVSCNWGGGSKTVNRPGTLDKTYGSGGIVISPEEAGSMDPGFRAGVILADGKFLAAAGAFGDDGWRGLIFRYQTNGALDTSFGSSGIASSSVEFTALAVDADGLIYAGGQYAVSGYKAALARFTAVGTPDTSFSDNGIYVDSYLTGGVFNKILPLPGGKILAAGWGDITSPNKRIDILMRLNSDGTVDTDFGTDGYVSFTLLVDGNYGQIMDIAIDAQDRIIVAGDISFMPFAGRVSSEGVFDDTFGETDGGVKSSMLYESLVSGTYANGRLDAVKIVGDGLFFAGNMRGGPNWNNTDGYYPVIIKAASDGSLSEGFGEGGLLLFEELLGLGNIKTLIYDNDNLYAGGFVDTSTSEGFIIKTDLAGSLNTAFGSEGVVKLHDIIPGFVPNMTNTYVNGLYADGNSKLTAWGYYYDDNGDQGFIMRFWK
jgi:uncharacterized delta-60 repeat protein